MLAANVAHKCVSPCRPPWFSEQHCGCPALMALECLPVPSKTALASRRQMFVREWQGPMPVAHSSPLNAGGNGCSHQSPSVLINFTPSSTLIIDNRVGSRPNFLAATHKVLPNAQTIYLVSFKMLTLHLKAPDVPILRSARVMPSGAAGEVDVFRERTDWLT